MKNRRTKRNHFIKLAQAGGVGLVVIEQCRVEVNILGSWLHIEHNINFLDIDNLLTDMIEGDLFYEDN